MASIAILARCRTRFRENAPKHRWRDPCSLGPGLLESVYRECLIAELRRAHLKFKIDRYVPLEYKGERIKGKLYIDLLVEECVVVELKAVESLLRVHQAQVITYLKLTGFPAGLLMNFNETTLRSGLRRLDHPDRYIKGKRSGE